VESGLADVGDVRMTDQWLKEKLLEETKDLLTFDDLVEPDDIIGETWGYCMSYCGVIAASPTPPRHGNCVGRALTRGESLACPLSSVDFKISEPQRAPDEPMPEAAGREGEAGLFVEGVDAGIRERLEIVGKYFPVAVFIPGPKHGASNLMQDLIWRF
jgi:hypothetical protein